MPPSSSAAAVLTKSPKRRALFLDVDGTLLDIAPTPDQVVVPPGLVGLLERVREGLDGALAILTGRQLEEIDALLAPAKFIGAGVHGAEIRTTPGGPIARATNALPDELAQELLALAERLPGIIAEPKGPGFAVHYRQAPEKKDAVESEIRRLLARFADDELVLCPGRKLFEVIPAGLSKGSALETLAAMAPFAGRAPVMIGDDVGDAPALQAAEQLGGTGLRVSGGFFGDAADLAGPAGVIEWLEQLAKKLQS